MIFDSLIQSQEEILRLIQEFSKTELFQHYTLIFIAVFASTPSFFFMPNEALTVPAYLLGVNPIAIIIAVGIGGFIGDALIFYFAHRLQNFLRRKKSKLDNRLSRLYRHKHIAFLLSPSLFFGLGDAILIIGAIRHVPFKGIAPYLFLGNLFRGIWSMLLVIYGIDLMKSLF